MLSKSVINKGILEAENSLHPQFQHGAVLFNKRRIFNSSPNDRSRYSKFADRFISNEFTATVHAEIGAILNQPKTVTEGSDIFVVRINKKGDLMNSKPCKMCQAAMEFVGIRNCYFSTSDGEIRKMRIC